MVPTLYRRPERPTGTGLIICNIEFMDDTTQQPNITIQSLGDLAVPQIGTAASTFEPSFAKASAAAEAMADKMACGPDFAMPGSCGKRWNPPSPAGSFQSAARGNLEFSIRALTPPALLAFVGQSRIVSPLPTLA